jgi:hypothetical protein
VAEIGELHGGFSITQWLWHSNDRRESSVRCVEIVRKIAEVHRRFLRGAPKEISVFSQRIRSRSFRAGIGRRLALGLAMALFAIVAGWVLIPPEASTTDQATVDWYSR